MRILHIMLACFYNEGFTYQENILPMMNKRAGNEVKIITSTEVFAEGNQLGYTKPTRYINKDGIEVVRLAYEKKIPHFLVKKIRKYIGTYREIEEFKPDVIFVHGMQTFDLIEVIKYKRKNKYVKIYADSHEDFNNSATNLVSKYFLHKGFYFPIICKALPYFEKVLYISYETKEFLQKMYGIDENILEYYPLGGIIFRKDIRDKYRDEIRKKYNLHSEDILIMHSGKFDEKKKTEELLRAFSKTNSSKMKLILIGKFDKEYTKKAYSLIEKDNRVMYEGWKSGDELLKYLCACDLYAQPGSQSATMQNALCCECPVMISPVKSHKYLLGEHAFYVESEKDMVDTFSAISIEREKLNFIRKQSFLIARNKLDYEILADRITR